MKKIFLGFFVFFCFFLLNTKVYALTEFEVNDVGEYFSAIEEINNSSNSEFKIILKSDIVVSDSSSVKNNNTIGNGNTVTIVGGGHTFKCVLSSNCRLKALGGNINLGLEDGSDTLVLEGNDTLSDTQESLVLISNGVVNMYDGVTLQKNKSEIMALTGAGVSIGGNGIFNMYGGVIQDNYTKSSAYGGAIILNADGAVFNMYDGTIQNNEATKLGGAIYQENGTVNLYKGTFKSNKSQYGGAIAVYGGPFNSYDVEYVSNEASYGGALLTTDVYGTEILINGSKFNSNKAVYGAGIMNYGGSNVSIENSTFEGNDATAGGAFMGYSGSSISSKNNIYKNNNAQQGGAIYSKISLTSDGDLITGNTASTGAGVYVVTSSFNFSTSDVYNNKASGFASDYYIGASVTSMSIKDASVMNGYATYGDKNVNLKNWYKDESGNRYSLENVTDVVDYSSITTGVGYSLTAGGEAIYVVKFSSNNGTDVADQYIEIGSKVSEPTGLTRYGYKIEGWYTDSKFNTKFDFNGEVSSNLNLFAKWERILYSIVEGNGQEVKDDDALFVVDADYSLFENGGRVFVDDDELTEAEFSSSKGSTKILLNKTYLSSLSEGDHLISVLFNDGGEADGTFVIGSKEVETTTIDNTVVDNPTTGDKILTYVLILGGLVVVLLGLLIVKKKFLKK